MSNNAAVTQKLTRVDKAAILLLSLGSADAAQVLRHMGPKEVQRVGVAMAQMRNVHREQVEQVMSEFVDIVGDQTSLGVGSDDYVRKMLTQALGEDKANGLIDRILLGGNTSGLDSLKWMEPRAVADVIRYEHPQIQAIVVAYLDPDQAGEVLNNFDHKVRLDIILRVSSLNTVQPAALKELNQILEKQFSGNSNAARTTLGGIKRAADIMNFLDSSIEGQLMDSIREVDEDLSTQIEDLMFVFNNLSDVDDRGTCWCWRSRGPTRASRKRFSRTCPSVRPNCCATTSRPRGRCASATWKPRRRKSSPSPAVWPKPEKSCSAARAAKR